MTPQLTDKCYHLL